MARLTTNKLAGVRREAVDMKMEMTTKLPAKATEVKMTMTKASIIGKQQNDLSTSHAGFIKFTTSL